jgi:hypothetical protein
LVAPLQRAVAIAEVNDAAMGIGEHLNFDMAGLAQEFLDIHFVIAETRHGFASRRGEGGADLVRAFREFHAASAAAARCLDQYRVSHVVGNPACRRLVAHRPVGAGHYGNA